MYETTENIAPNTDLICSYIPADAAQNEQQQQVAQLKRAMEAIIKGMFFFLNRKLVNIANFFRNLTKMI